MRYLVMPYALPLYPMPYLYAPCHPPTPYAIPCLALPYVPRTFFEIPYWLRTVFKHLLLARYILMNMILIWRRSHHEIRFKTNPVNSI
jgi:hypothetical protein